MWKNGRNDQRQRAAKALNEPIVEDVVVYGRTNDTESKVNWTIIRPGPIEGSETGVPAEFYEASPQKGSMKTGYLDIGIYDREEMGLKDPDSKGLHIWIAVIAQGLVASSKKAPRLVEAWGTFSPSKLTFIHYTQAYFCA